MRASGAAPRNSSSYRIVTGGRNVAWASRGDNRTTRSTYGAAAVDNNGRRASSDGVLYLGRMFFFAASAHRLYDCVHAPHHRDCGTTSARGSLAAPVPKPAPAAGAGVDAPPGDRWPALVTRLDEGKSRRDHDMSAVTRSAAPPRLLLRGRLRTFSRAHTTGTAGPARTTRRPTQSTAAVVRASAATAVRVSAMKPVVRVRAEVTEPAAPADTSMTLQALVPGARTALARPGGCVPATASTRPGATSTSAALPAGCDALARPCPAIGPTLAATTRLRAAATPTPASALAACARGGDAPPAHDDFLGKEALSCAAAAAATPASRSSVRFLTRPASPRTPHSTAFTTKRALHPAAPALPSAPIARRCGHASGARCPSGPRPSGHAHVRTCGWGRGRGGAERRRGSGEEFLFHV
ncbi:hypothetical protein K438DRAFT_1178845 [Mycena galopus ATCC 62051]|nr:hypothetical protein K438DRAFT_1178845 [Mycena galopus ATCC 62051]